MAYAWETVATLQGSTGSFILEAEVEEASADGRIRTIRLTNNDGIPHHAQAMYQVRKGVYQLVPQPPAECPPGQVITYTISGNVQVGDVTQLLVS